MKRHLTLAAILLSLALSAVAQDATLITPVVQPTLTNVKVFRLTIDATQPSIHVMLRQFSAGDVGGEVINVRIENTEEAPNAVRDALATIMTVRAGESGGAAKRFNQRVIKACIDAGVLPGVSIP